MTMIPLGTVNTTPPYYPGRSGGDVLPYAYPTTAPYNVDTHCTVPTYEGSGAAIHPSVVDFADRKWHGFRFWMAMTPFPNNASAYENPSIVASNDGVTWVVPDGLTNPVYPKPELYYNSDTHLSYDPDTDELVLVFRSGDFLPRVARSADGVTWPATPIKVDFANLQGAEPQSPALVRVSSDLWYIFYAMRITTTWREVWRWEATAPDAAWTNPTQCLGIPDQQPERLPSIWHLDVAGFAGRFWLLAAEDFGDGETSRFYLGTSVDGEHWSYADHPVITEGSGNWDDLALYKGTLVPHEDGAHMRVWYCGRSTTQTWRIGQTVIPLIEWPEPPTEGPVMRNKVKNADFARGAIPWNANSATPTANLDGTLTLAMGAESGSASTTIYAQPLGRKFYVAADFKPTGVLPSQFKLTWTTSTASTVPTTLDEWVHLSAVLETKNATSTRVAFSATYPAGTNFTGLTWDLRRPFVLDLTSFFGAGNEPTAAQFETILAAYGGWIATEAPFAAALAAALVRTT